MAQVRTKDRTAMNRSPKDNGKWNSANDNMKHEKKTGSPAHLALSGAKIGI
jgi:hypothetical protein